MTISWLADKIEQWPTAKLVPYARNARTHSESQVAQIAASIAEFGFVNPVLVDTAGVLVAGHGRVLAAKRLYQPLHGETHASLPRRGGDLIRLVWFWGRSLCLLV